MRPTQVAGQRFLEHQAVTWFEDAQRQELLRQEDAVPEGHHRHDDGRDHAITLKGIGVNANGGQDMCLTIAQGLSAVGLPASQGETDWSDGTSPPSVLRNRCASAGFR
jgi:hypothetical protein